MLPPMRATAFLLSTGLIAAACSAGTAPLSQPTPEPADRASPPTSEADAAPSPTTEPSTTAPTTPTTVSPSDRGCTASEPAAAPGGPASSMTVLSQDPRVEAAVYPRPSHSGDPWSQWGQGLVLPDGRFLSAIGDHLGADGNSYLFEYEPTTGQLARVADVASMAGHQAGDWGYGKVHGQLVPMGCDTVVFATYWGSRDGIEYTDRYQGDFLALWDTNDHSFEVLDVPVPGHGLPSIAGSAEHGLIYGEAVDPFLEGNQGVFFTYEMESGAVATFDQKGHKGFRSVLVDAEGQALFAAGDGQLWEYDPETEDVTARRTNLPGDWLRAATPPGPSGTVYGATRNPDALFALSPDGDVRSLGLARGYVASLALSPDGSTLYYVPGAHGSAWEQGTPLIAVDVTTGEETVVVELNDMAEEALGLRLGGTYNVAVDPDGSRLYVGFNAGEAGAESFGEVVLVMVELESSGTAPSGSSTEIRLSDATAELGLVDPLAGMHGHVAGVADTNGDGWVDLLVGGFGDRPREDYSLRGAGGPVSDALLLGGPDGFEVAARVGPPTTRTGGAAWADLDGDADLDLVVSRNVRNDVDKTVVLENREGRFVEVRVLDDSRAARAIGVLDHDGDGRLDLLLTEDKWGGASSVLLHNEGAFNFSDATRAAGLPRDVHALGLGVGDLTGDGWADLVFGGSNRVFVAVGDGSFVEASASPLPWPIEGNEDDPAGVSLADVNRDGWIDVLVGQHHNSTVDEGAAAPVRLFLNRGLDGSGGPLLEDVTAATGLTALPTKAPHVQVADLDNDGWPEVVTSAGAQGGSEPAIFRHLGVDAAGMPQFEAPAGLGTDQYWVTGAIADIDRDGRQDVFLVEWEPALPSRLWLNDSAAGNWLEIEAPIGATVSVYEAGRAGADDALIGARPIVGSTGYAAGTAPVAHFGIGEAAAVDVVVALPGGASVTEPSVRANMRQSVGL